MYFLHTIYLQTTRRLTAEGPESGPTYPKKP
jgi:hypothetical protein